MADYEEFYRKQTHDILRQPTTWIKKPIELDEDIPIDEDTADEWDEDRMDEIGQNGNNGDHYG